jgi:hypothetical protein
VKEQSFSERHGLAADAPEIIVRQEAPHDLRGFLIDFAYKSGLDPHRVRDIVCKVLLTRPDESNWSAYPNVDHEVRKLLDGCEWFGVYDVIEAILDSLKRNADRGGLTKEGERPDAHFAAQLNDFFVRKGIGWQLTDGRIEVRGAEAFQMAVGPVAARLEASGMPTAAQEIHEALRDLGRRPKPDITGAIQHAVAAAECVAREVSGDKKATLGEILDRYPGLIPRPLDEGLKKIWGYASEMARHIREGREPSYEEAELAVITSAGVVTYLLRKSKA